jgi:chemotaxis protein CheX
MNVAFMNPFLSATISVLKTMAFTEAVPGKPYLKKDKIARGDVSGIIGISGPPNGSLSLTFSQACILKIVSNMLGEQAQEINDDIRDAVGELTNMISGAARNELGNEGYVFRTSIPITVSGPKHTIKHQCNGQTIAIPFTTETGSFLVEVSFEE